MTDKTCGWTDDPDFFEGTEPEKCASGKPATFENCGLVDVPVCEDHRCRCPFGEPLPAPIQPRSVEGRMTGPRLAAIRETFRGWRATSAPIMTGMGQELIEELDATRAGLSRQGCPCRHTMPCHPQCTCANGAYSRGCSRCCSYGSPEQQRAAAEHLAAAEHRATLAESRAAAEEAVAGRMREALTWLQAHVRYDDPFNEKLALEHIDAALKAKS